MLTDQNQSSFAPKHALPLSESKPEWSKLKAGIWFKCSCGRIGHISHLLFVDEETTMWCPNCGTDNWSWTKNGSIKTTEN